MFSKIIKEQFLQVNKILQRPALQMSYIVSEQHLDHVLVH